LKSLTQNIFPFFAEKRGFFVPANCDNPEEVIANCENPQETSLSQYDIEKLIVTVRGEQVLIDQDIARIYGVTCYRVRMGCMDLRVRLGKKRQTTDCVD
jgi:hypothetical protein